MGNQESSPITTRRWIQGFSSSKTTTTRNNSVNSVVDNYGSVAAVSNNIANNTKSNTGITQEEIDPDQDQASSIVSALSGDDGHDEDEDDDDDDDDDQSSTIIGLCYSGSVSSTASSLRSKSGATCSADDGGASSSGSGISTLSSSCLSTLLLETDMGGQQMIPSSLFPRLDLDDTSNDEYDNELLFQHGITGPTTTTTTTTTTTCENRKRKHQQLIKSQCVSPPRPAPNKKRTIATHTRRPSSSASSSSSTSSELFFQIFTPESDHLISCEIQPQQRTTRTSLYPSYYDRSNHNNSSSAHQHQKNRNIYQQRRDPITMHLREVPNGVEQIDSESRSLSHHSSSNTRVFMTLAICGVIVYYLLPFGKVIPSPLSLLS